jgi:hypothetical protein
MKIRTLSAALAAIIVSAGIAAAGLYNFPFASSTATSRSAATLPMTGSECIPGDTNLSGGRAPQTACYTQGNLRGNYVVTLTDGTTITPNVSSGAQLYKVTLGGNRTMAAPTGLVTGQRFEMEIIQDGTGSRTLTWNSLYSWPAGTAPTLTTTASKADLFTFMYSGTAILATGANSQNRTP